MGHKVDYRSLKDFEFGTQLVSSVGGGENKELFAFVKGSKITYRVYEEGEVLLSTRYLRIAVDKYNEV